MADQVSQFGMGVSRYFPGGIRLVLRLVHRKQLVRCSSREDHLPARQFPRPDAVRTVLFVFPRSLQVRSTTRLLRGQSAATGTMYGLMYSFLSYVFYKVDPK